MKKIKIVQVGFSYQHGGIESFALSYDPYLNDSEYQVDYINVFPYSKNIKLFKELAGKRNIIELPDYRKKPLSYIIAFYKLQKQERYRVLHYNMNSASFLIPLIAAKISKVPVIISHAHNSSSDKGKIKEMVHNFNRHLIPLFCNAFFSCSNLASKWFFSDKTINGNNYYRINNAIELERFSYDKKMRKKLRDELGANDDTLVIGHVGRFDKQKNQRFLIDLFDKYVTTSNDALLLLIGDGTLLQEIQSYTESKHHIQNKVIFLGQISNVNEYLNAMDIFILPSLYEGLPYVGIEAQVNGLPCIFSSAISTELELTDNVIFERLSNGEDIWIKAIRKLVKQHIIRETHMIHEYEIKHSAEQLRKIYISLIRQCEVDVDV